MRRSSNGKVVRLILIIVFICWLWFAFIPEYFNFSLPTGGWDWLVFTGTIVGIYVAYYGIREQMINNHQSMLKQ